MKTNWLWDTRLKENEVRKILKNPDNPRFDIYAEKLLSRIEDPKVAFSFIDKKTFCSKWPTIKKNMIKDQWLETRVIFWQAIYEKAHVDLRSSSINVSTQRSEGNVFMHMKLAKLIRETRIRLGYTQKIMAKKLGVIQQYVSKIERGRENLSIDTLARIAHVLKKDVIIRLK